MVVTSCYKWKSENQRVIESLGVPQPLLSSTSKELPEYVPRRTVDASQTSSASGYTDTEALTHADMTVGPPHSDPEVNNSILCSLTRLSKCLVPKPSRKEYGPHIFVHVKFTIGFFFLDRYGPVFLWLLAIDIFTVHATFSTSLYRIFLTCKWASNEFSCPTFSADFCHHTC